MCGTVSSIYLSNVSCAFLLAHELLFLHGEGQFCLLSCRMANRFCSFASSPPRSSNKLLLYAVLHSGFIKTWRKNFASLRFLLLLLTSGICVSLLKIETSGRVWLTANLRFRTSKRPRNTRTLCLHGARKKNSDCSYVCLKTWLRLSAVMGGSLVHWRCQGETWPQNVSAWQWVPN